MDTPQGPLFIPPETRGARHETTPRLPGVARLPRAEQEVAPALEFEHPAPPARPEPRRWLGGDRGRRTVPGAGDAPADGQRATGQSASQAARAIERARERDPLAGLRPAKPASERERLL